MSYYDEIKNELINNEIYRKVKNYSINKNDLNTYYNVGQLLLEAGKYYGENTIKDYSIKLSNDLGKGYSQSDLRNMIQFYKVSHKWQIYLLNHQIITIYLMLSMIQKRK